MFSPLCLEFSGSPGTFEILLGFFVCFSLCNSYVTVLHFSRPKFTFHVTERRDIWSMLFPFLTCLYGRFFFLPFIHALQPLIIRHWYRFQFFAARFALYFAMFFPVFLHHFLFSCKSTYNQTSKSSEHLSYFMFRG